MCPGFSCTFAVNYAGHKVIQVKILGNFGFLGGVRVACPFNFLLCVCCLVCLCPVSSVSNVVGVSGLSILDCTFGFLSRLFNINLGL